MCIFHLAHTRMRYTVGTYQTVAAEVTVAWHVGTEVSSVCPECLTILVMCQHTLVHPVPDVSTLQVRITVDSFPLIPQTSGRVTHGMCIFRRHHRTVATILTSAFQPACAGVLRHVHIRVPFPLSAFVVHRAVHDILVRFLHPKISLVEVISVSGLVTQRPERKTRVVLVAFKHVDGTVHVRFQPFRVITQCTSLAQVVIHTVAFDVGFIVHIQTIFIAQFIEATVLRIVTQTNSIDVVALHQFKVFAHQLFRYIVSGFRIVFVDVHPFQLDRLSVDEQYHIILSVGCFLVDFLDLNAAESHIIRNHLAHLSIFFHRHVQFVQVRCFRSPGSHIRQFLAERYRRKFAVFHLCRLFSRGYRLSVFIGQLVTHAQVGGRCLMILQVDLQAEDTVTITIVQSGSNTEILYGCFGL